MSGSAVDPLNRSRTLTAAATDAIRQAVADGRLVPGELHSVAELAGLLGVSRTPVREALLILEHDGVVSFARNRGVRVREASAEDIREIFEMREMLEVPAVRRAAGRLGDRGLDAIRAELEAMSELARTGNESGFMAHDQAFHEVILRAAGNSRVADAVGRLRAGVRFAGASTAGRSRELEDILEEHRRILTALESGDGAAAAKAMRDHLRETATLLRSQT